MADSDQKQYRQHITRDIDQGKRTCNHDVGGVLPGQMQRHQRLWPLQPYLHLHFVQRHDSEPRISRLPFKLGSQPYMQILPAEQLFQSCILWVWAFGFSENRPQQLYIDISSIIDCCHSPSAYRSQDTHCIEDMHAFPAKRRLMEVREYRPATPCS